MSLLLCGALCNLSHHFLRKTIRKRYRQIPPKISRHPHDLITRTTKKNTREHKVATRVYVVIKWQQVVVVAALWSIYTRRSQNPHLVGDFIRYIIVSRRLLRARLHWSRSPNPLLTLHCGCHHFHFSETSSLWKNSRAHTTHTQRVSSTTPGSAVALLKCPYITHYPLAINHSQ